MRRESNQGNHSMSRTSKSRGDNGKRRSRATEDVSMTGELANDLSEMRSDLVKLGEDAAITARHSAQIAEHYAKSASEQTMQGMEQAWQFVQKRPVTTVLIAVGVGAIFARMISSRS